MLKKMGIIPAGIIVGGIVLAGLFCIMGCTTNMKPFEEGDRSSSKKVLIAAEGSGFKKAVVEAVIERLGTEEWYFRGIGLGELTETSEDEVEQYGAVLIVCKMTGGRVESQARAFVDKERRNPKLVVLMTTGGDGTLPEGAQSDLNKVDAVSSASKTAYVEESAEEIAALLQERF
jgi:hypothetical protein